MRSADVPALEHRDARAQPRGLQRHCEAGQAGTDNADIDIQIERQAQAQLRRSGIGPFVVLVEVSSCRFLTDRRGACHLV